ncbi:hypothetical protein JCM16138_24670 [Thermococcus atlanticus]
MNPETEKAISEFLNFIKNISGKLRTEKKRRVAYSLLKAFAEHHGRIKAYEMGSKDGIVFRIAQKTGVSYVYVYEVLKELIDLGLIAKTITGYEISPIFRKRLFRLYKALGNL